ncbi:hypothetical protein [uncultured Brevibacillus sp.]|uniref:hypothetical protein n=1 Tax=uncultured Brevibacillus sp. TaxID=169970 RepID=UPI0025945F66|nr:hypothetical protein [uncultured Brevibacillus sp.]
MELIKKIEVVTMKSKYCDVEHHTIVIDDTPLDLLLSRQYPSNHLLGLIPTIIDWIDNPQEKEFLRQRFQSTNKEVILPILMCADDCDMFCTVIVAKVVKANGYIIWDQIGIDMSSDEFKLWGYEGIGMRVNWLEKIPLMTFEEGQYFVELGKIYNR